MKNLLILAVFAASLTAQVAQFPGNVAGDPQLKVSGNNLQTQLVGTIGAGDTIITVAAPSMFSANMLISIDLEILSITSTNGPFLTVVRGFDGTTATKHASGRTVSAFIDAWHHNALSKEIQAIENTLGANLVNVLSAASAGQGVATLAYNFGPQTPGGSLTAATVSVVTMAPCPLGVNGTDLGHWLYVTGGTGTPEPVKITGGTCTSGALTGTVIFTPANSHSGAWTLRSSAGGIPEALQAVGQAGGGTVFITPGTINLHASILVPNHTNLVGSGRGNTVLFVPNGEFTNSPQWRLYGLNPSGVVIGANPGSTVTIQGFTVNMNGANQPSPPNGTYGIELVNALYSRITDTEVNNLPILTSLNTALAYGLLGTTANSTADHNYVYNLVCTISSEGTGGFIVGGTSNRILYNYVSNGCNSAYVTGGQDTLFQGNVFELGASFQVAGSQAYANDDGSGARFIGNSCLGNGVGPACFATTTDNNIDTLDTTFSDNIARNCGQGYQFQSSSATSRHINVSGGAVVNCITPLSISNTIDRISIRGVTNILAGHSDAVGTFSTLVNGANQNVSIGDYGVIRTSGTAGPSGAFSIGGFANGIDGRELTVINNAGQPLTLNNTDSGSLAANRICTGTGGNVTLVHSLATLVYSVPDSCWWIKAQN